MAVKFIHCLFLSLMLVLAACGSTPAVDPALPTATSSIAPTTTASATATAEASVVPAPTGTAALVVSPTAAPIATAEGELTAGELAYIADGAIMIRDFATGEQREVSRGVRISDPAWSPDGTLLAFTDYNDIIVAQPGEERVQLTRGENINSSPAYAPDGTLFFVRHVAPAEPSRIEIVRWSDGQETVVHTEPGGLCAPTDLQMLAGNRALLSLTCGRGKNVLLIDLESGASQDVAQTYLPASEGCAFGASSATQGQYLAVLTSVECLPEQSRRLVLIDVEAKTSRVLLEDARANVVTWSPDQRAIVFERSAATGEQEGIWLLPLDQPEALQQIESVGRSPAWRPVTP